MIKISRFVIKIYQQLLSPFGGPRCRFYPSCSWYALDALSTHGFFRGWWMTIKRLARCHPFNEGGFDEVQGKAQ